MRKFFRKQHTRGQKLRRDLLLLLLLAVLGWVLLDFPCFTRNQAFSALEDRNFYGNGQVLRTLEGNYGHQYRITRAGDCYAWEQVWPVLFSRVLWQPGQMEVISDDPEAPLVALPVDPDFLPGVVAVVSHDASIVTVEVTYPALCRPGGPEGWQKVTISSADCVNNCFLLRAPEEEAAQLDHQAMDALSLTGYDAAGAVVWRSPQPDWSLYGWN